MGNNSHSGRYKPLRQTQFSKITATSVHFMGTGRAPRLSRPRTGFEPNDAPMEIEDQSLTVVPINNIYSSPPPPSCEQIIYPTRNLVVPSGSEPLSSTRTSIGENDEPKIEVKEEERVAKFGTWGWNHFPPPYPSLIYFVP